jgi:hypothetical protein
MAAETNPEKLTLGEALKDLGWFPLLFAVVVGGPSILAILEQVLVSHQLVPALQWIVDGYSRMMAVLGAAVEPLVQPPIDWMNAWFGWSLTLGTVWRPVFALCMVFLMALMRTGLRSGNVARAAINGGLLGTWLLAVALLIGLFSAGAGWLAQGAVAAVPVAMFGFALTAIWAADGNWRAVRFALAKFGAVSLVLFAIGAGLSFVPNLAQSAGLFVLSGAVALFGAYFVSDGLSDRNRDFSRIGLTTLGGFVAAGLILAADFTLKALGAV